MPKEELEYGKKILGECGLPRTGNLPLVVDCLESLQVKLKCSPREAAAWLWKRVRRAQQLGANIGTFWFQDGLYNTVPMRPEKTVPNYVAIDGAAVRLEQSTAEWEEASARARAKLREIASTPQWRQRQQANFR